MSKLAPCVPQETSSCLDGGCARRDQSDVQSADPKHSADRLAGDKTPITQPVHIRQLIPDKTALELTGCAVHCHSRHSMRYIRTDRRDGSQIFELGSPKLEPIDALSPRALDPRNRGPLRGKNSAWKYLRKSGRCGTSDLRVPQYRTGPGIRFGGRPQSLISQFFIDIFRFVDYLSDVQVPEEVKRRKNSRCWWKSRPLARTTELHPRKLGRRLPTSVKPYTPKRLSHLHAPRCRRRPSPGTSAVGSATGESHGDER